MGSSGGKSMTKEDNQHNTDQVLPSLYPTLDAGTVAEAQEANSKRKDEKSIGTETNQLEEMYPNLDETLADISQNDQRVNLADENKIDNSNVATTQAQSSYIPMPSYQPYPYPYVPFIPNLKFQFTTNRGLIVKIYQCAVIKASVNAIVSSSDRNLSNTEGIIARDISQNAGNDFAKECLEAVKNKGPIKVTENHVTSAGGLPFTAVIHSVGPKWGDYRDKEKCLKDLKDTVINILHAAVVNKFYSVAMPPIGSGILGIPKNLCGAMYIRGVMEFCEYCFDIGPFREFHLIDLKDDTLDITINSYNSWMTNKNSLDVHLLLKQPHTQADRRLHKADLKSENTTTSYHRRQQEAKHRQLGKPLEATKKEETRKHLQRDQTQHSSASSRGECAVCLDREVNSALNKCGHMCMCLECAVNIKATTGLCPICKQKIEGVIKIFQS